MTWDSALFSTDLSTLALSVTVSVSAFDFLPAPVVTSLPLSEEDYGEKTPNELRNFHKRMRICRLWTSGGSSGSGSSLVAVQVTTLGWPCLRVGHRLVWGRTVHKRGSDAVRVGSDKFECE